MKINKKCLFTFWGFLLLITILNAKPASASPSSVVNVPDNHLRNAIIFQLRIKSPYTITVKDMESLTTLELKCSDPIHSSIKSIEGLQYCKNLRKLNLEGNRVLDLSPLSSLYNLKDLNLSNNFKLSNISPLSKLYNLESLNLESNRTSNIATIANLYNLKSLNVKYNKISDISSLALLYHLQSLDISCNEISNISYLSRLTNLQSLDLIGNKIDDLYSLSKLTNLQTLYVAYNRISSVTPLTNMKNLRNLNLASNQISDITPLSRKMPKLHTLDIGDNKISDLSPILTFSSLRNLSAYNEKIVLDDETVAESSNYQLTNPVKVSDVMPITCISDISNGGTFNSTNNTISWNNLNNLQVLSYKFNQTFHISGLPDFTFYGTVTKKVTFPPLQITDVALNNLLHDSANLDYNTPLTKENLKNITFLYGKNKGIKSLSGLENCTNLSYIDFSDNEITDLSPLSKLTNLKSIDISGNKIKDFSPIKFLNLTSLNTENQRI